jgi:hypothetical protein
MPPHVTFKDIYDCLVDHGPATVVSSVGTQYEVTAQPTTKGKNKGVETIIGQLPSGRPNDAVRIHADCWGEDKTCAGTRAGGLLNGKPSLYDWYAEHCGKV